MIPYLWINNLIIDFLKIRRKTINLNISSNFLLMELLEGFLKESYVLAEEDKLKKQKEKYISSGFSR